MQADCIDYLCVPGHKGLYGPMGIGMLLCGSEQLLPLIEGNRKLFHRVQAASELPDRFESGIKYRRYLRAAGRMEFVKGIESGKYANRKPHICGIYTISSET